jgi:hypothetical protein
MLKIIHFTVIACLSIIILCVSSSDNFVQAQSQTITQFGNTDYDNSWNVMGGVIVASQFHLEQSLTVTWMSVLTQDNSPPSYIRLGIFSDANNNPSICLGSTTVVQSQISFGWYSIPLSKSITLQPGTYWLAEVDSGATVLKFVQSPASSRTVYTPLTQTFMQQLNEGNTLSLQLKSLSGTVAILASLGKPSLEMNSHSSNPYAAGAQCWTSSSSSNPYPIQPSFEVNSPVYIYWSPYGPTTGAVDISVYQPGQTPEVTAAYRSYISVIPSSKPVSFTPNVPGTWIISCNGYSTIITITPVDVFVLPEYSLGSLLSLCACLAAFTLLYLRNKNISFR